MSFDNFDFLRDDLRRINTKLNVLLALVWASNIISFVIYWAKLI